MIIPLFATLYPLSSNAKQRRWSGYEIMKPPLTYVPIRAAPSKLTATPTPVRLFLFRSLVVLQDNIIRNIDGIGWLCDRRRV
jgi:hypothetical protein